MRDYIETPLGWSLIKPHGSMAWFFEQPAAFDPRTPAGDQPIVRQDIQCEPTTAFDLAALRASDVGNPHGPAVRYPALALPDGPKDELVLSPEHLAHLRGILGSSQEIYLLVLGYSALDTEILKLITESECKVRRMTVVNSDVMPALEVFDRVTSTGMKPIWPDVFDGSYASGSTTMGCRVGPRSTWADPSQRMIQPNCVERWRSVAATKRLNVGFQLATASGRASSDIDSLRGRGRPSAPGCQVTGASTAIPWCWHPAWSWLSKVSTAATVPALCRAAAALRWIASSVRTSGGSIAAAVRRRGLVIRTSLMFERS